MDKIHRPIISRASHFRQSNFGPLFVAHHRDLDETILGPAAGAFFVGFGPWV